MQFDVVELEAGPSMVVNCQSDLLAHLQTRFVIPLLPEADAPPGTPRLNPRFKIGRTTYLLAPNLAASVPARALGRVVASLADEHLRVTSAIDVVVSGV